MLALGAFILGHNHDCGPSGNPDLILLELEDEGQNLIVGFDPQQKIYDVTVSKNPVTVKATPAEAGSTIQVSYMGADWVSPVSGAAEHDVNVALGDTVIVVIATTTGSAWRSYLINVTHDQPATTKTINVACTSGVLQPNFIGLDLTVKTPSLPDGASSKPFTAEVGGVARFPRWIMQPASKIVPGGIQQAVLVEVAVTAQVRSGATGDDVLLREDASAISPGLTNFCQFPPDQVCDPANDLDPNDPSMGNTDCLGGVQGVSCLPARLVIDLPVSTDCGPGGACEAIGEGFADEDSACDLNGNCIVDDLDIPLATATMDLTPDPSGEILLGFADQNVPDLTLCPDPDPDECTQPFHADGSYDIPAAVYAEPAPPTGFRVDLMSLIAPLQCAMAEPGGVCAGQTTLGCLTDADCGGAAPCDFVSVEGVSMPTPDSSLLAIPIGDPGP